MASKGWGPWRQRWYSVCSTHAAAEPQCPQCEAGCWVYVLTNLFERAVFRVAPSLWLWWVNR
jgi:hypothetical protein